jgi:signal transduction histidine kinase
MVFIVASVVELGATLRRAVGAVVGRLGDLRRLAGYAARRTAVIRGGDVEHSAARYRRSVARVRLIARRLGRYPADVAIGAGLAVVAQLELWSPDLIPGVSGTNDSGALLATTALLSTLPLAGRRVAPLGSALAVLAGLLVGHALSSPPEGLSELAAIIIAAYSVAAYAQRRAAAIGLVAAFAVVVVVVEGDWDDFAFVAVLLGASWLAGRTVRANRLRAMELQQLAAQLAQEREEKAELAVALERSRLARELHDVVAHAVSVMVVQAGGVRGMLRPEQREERAALAAVESTGREAMAELRRMLGILRRGADGAGLDPPPRLAHLDRLVNQVNHTGASVELELAGTPCPLAPGLELCAYRVVQEALTNVVKHAGHATAHVTVSYGERELTLEVTDDGPGPRNGEPGGHGLAGMRERVALYAGQLETGPHPGGGFRVQARFPLERSQA